ncbi:MAG: hypothetical protein WCO66_04170 [Candidatus Absconditabacteria bacterium]
MEQQPIDQVPTIQNSLPIPPPMESSLFYVPSSIQKKRALMMYFLMGIVLVLSEKKTNEFEYFHLKQAIGWWIGFFVLLLAVVLLLFIPYIKVLGVLGILAWVGLLVCFAKQARDGIYKKDLNAYRGAIFPSLGNRVVSLFELSFDEQKDTPSIS